MFKVIKIIILKIGERGLPHLEQFFSPDADQGHTG